MRSFTLEISSLSIPQPLKEQLPQAPYIRKRLIVISGPTAVGKSETALEFAQKVQGEIITADSMQVYKMMNIGTAKPSIEEQLCVPHHLLDIRMPHEGYSVIDYVKDAREAIDSVLARNKLPILVGGTGFYLKSLLFGPPQGPPPCQRVRDALEKEIQEKGLEAMYAKLVQLDPVYSKNLSSHDHYKILRAMEIIQLSGKPVSSFRWAQGQQPRYEARCWFLNRPRESLYKKIDKRCDKMVQNGLVEETAFLLEQNIENNPSACHAIGYRQAIEYLRSPRSKSDFENFISSFKQATRHYAKRQTTWFRKEPLYRWLDLDRHDPETVIDILLNDLAYLDWSL